MWTESPVEQFERLGLQIGVDLFAKRDDLLPFPLAGNKYRKITAELAGRELGGSVLITNGGIQSNHCRTLAMMGAQRGTKVHLVLHGDPTREAPSLAMYDALGASIDIVPAARISHTIRSRAEAYRAAGLRPDIVTGGCHTRLGAVSYRDAAYVAINSLRPDVIVVASGTGATQGGIVAGAELAGRTTRVIGISVARGRERGAAAVAEAAIWAGSRAPEVEFLDSYIDGGYGNSSSATLEAVRVGWRFGLPLDPTYTGKAFAGLMDLRKQGDIAEGSRVLFWHTGGLWNVLSHMGLVPQPDSATPL